MMMYKSVFQRYEKKYLIGQFQYEALMKRIEDKMCPDEYGAYTISNLYFDTDAYDLARSCARKPLYKEKLRLRSYGEAVGEAPVFLELKKKFRGIVYKRRVRLSYNDAVALLSCGIYRQDSQVLREIKYFMSCYPGLEPKVFLAYDRQAFTGKDDRDIRITFDTNIRFRRKNLRLDRGSQGAPILEPGNVLVELKTLGPIPFWLCRALSECEVYPASFSKYGKCYADFLQESSVMVPEPDVFTWEECTSA
jgi:hypothetical protein